MAEGVNAYTQGSAYARFADDRIGRLLPGREAHLAVLSQDIFSVPPAEIGRARVVLTHGQREGRLHGAEITAAPWWDRPPARRGISSYGSNVTMY